MTNIDKFVIFFVADVKSDVFKTKKAGDDTSDEEKEWLDALEKGELDDMGGLKKDKDPLLMTARQVGADWNDLRLCFLFFRKFQAVPILHY